MHDGQQGAKELAFLAVRQRLTECLKTPPCNGFLALAEGYRQAQEAARLEALNMIAVGRFKLVVREGDVVKAIDAQPSDIETVHQSRLAALAGFERTYQRQLLGIELRAASEEYQSKKRQMMSSVDIDDQGISLSRAREACLEAAGAWRSVGLRLYELADSNSKIMVLGPEDKEILQDAGGVQRMYSKMRAIVLACRSRVNARNAVADGGPVASAKHDDLKGLRESRQNGLSETERISRERSLLMTQIDKDRRQLDKLELCIQRALDRRIGLTSAADVVDQSRQLIATLRQSLTALIGLGGIPPPMEGLNEGRVTVGHTDWYTNQRLVRLEKLSKQVVGELTTMESEQERVALLSPQVEKHLRDYISAKRRITAYLHIDQHRAELLSAFTDCRKAANLWRQCAFQLADFPEQQPLISDPENPSTRLKPAAVRGAYLKMLDAILSLYQTAVAPISAQRSRLATAGGLTIQELSGHTLAEHVGTTEKGLRERLHQQVNIRAASSFNDRRTAERVIAAAIAAETHRIEKWIAGSRPELRIGLRTLGEGFGKHVRRGEPCRVVSGMLAILVRKKDAPNEYFIKTAYPIP